MAIETLFNTNSSLSTMLMFLRTEICFFISECQICREIGEEYNSKKYFLSSTDFILETVCPDGKSKEQKKKLKQEKVPDFLKIINAMLNEGHGILCVHTSTPHLLGPFDEAVNKRMFSLIPDDTLFDDNFERHFKDKEHVIFRVRPRRRPFSTCCFNTKLSTDTGLVDPTPGQMRYFLKKQSETHPDQQDSEIPEQDTTLIFTEGEEVKVSIGNTDIVFQESIRTQAKQMPQMSEGDRKKWSYGNILRFFEEKNRLQKYITAFSKLKTGGSIFWGVSEQKEENKNWTEMNMTPKQTQLLQSFDQPALKLYKDKKQEHVYHIASESQVPTTGGQKTGEFRCQGIHPEGQDVNDFANRLIRDMKIKMLWVDRATILDPSKETSDDVSNHIKLNSTQSEPARVWIRTKLSLKYA